MDFVRKTGRLIVADAAWRTMGFGAEVLAIVAEEAFGDLKCSPRRIALPDVPTPSTPALANHYYPRAVHIMNAARMMMGLPEQTEEQLGIRRDTPLDAPDKSFTGQY